MWKGLHGETAMPLDANYWKGCGFRGGHERDILYWVGEMQRTTGTLSPGGHPGSYNGQDAYNDMLVNDGSKGYRERTIASDGNVGCDEHAGCHARCASDFSRGGVIG